MDSKLKNHLETQIANEIDNPIQFVWSMVGGGSINDAYKLDTGNGTFLIKTNTTDVFENGFDEEVLGLQFLQQKGALTPKIICNGSAGNYIYLVLEWIESGSQTIDFWKNFADQLAHLHSNESDRFGLNHTNFMGQLKQENHYFDNFCDFFIENRLKPQIAISFNNRLLEKNHLVKFERLYKELDNLLPVEKPSAVHGDLWSGNFICNKNEKGVFIDPAVYFGHREIDLAMSTLFGGFSDIFYRRYQEIYPMTAGFDQRKDIYNLYPLLIHLNLFGSSYRSSIVRIIDRF